MPSEEHQERIRAYYNTTFFNSHLIGDDENIWADYSANEEGFIIDPFYTDHDDSGIERFGTSPREKEFIVGTGMFIKPVSGGRLSSGFGPRGDPFNGGRKMHRGTDFALPTGAPIYASRGGTVTLSGTGLSGFGIAVVIDHGGGYVTRYAHCSKTIVRVGQQVEQGEKIAEVGSTGRSTGPHLHFEIMVNGKHVDPMLYISK